MGTLYRNGIPYVGSGGAGGVEVTQAEYDALPTSEKMNGSIYFITDGSVSYPTASQMRYDNTESGIPSTSVQGAIDELKIEIGDTDISSIGDGTLSGAVSELSNGLFTDLSYGLSEYDFPGFSIIRATPTSTQIPVTGVNVTKAPVSDCFAVVQYYNGSSNVFGTLQAVSSGKLYLLNSSGARVTGSYVEGTLVYPLPH